MAVPDGQDEALNRLVQVNLPGSVVFAADGSGQIVNRAALGDLIWRYSYDGLGRLTLDTNLPSYV